MGLGGLPGQPTAPYKVEINSTETSLTVAWAASPEVDNIDIDGYILYMDDGHHGDYQLVYNGTLYP